MALAVIYCITFLTFLCIPNSHATVTDNVLKTDLKVQCKSDKDCKGFDGYTCSNNFCTCTKDECQEINSIVDLVPKIGGACSNSDQCLVEKSFCGKKGRCECEQGTVSASNKRGCFNVSEYESDCEDNVQCKAFDGICLENKCSCDKTKHFINKMCYNSAGLGSSCRKDEECFITEFSICKEHKCMCKTDYVKSSSKSACLPKATGIGSKCSEDFQCKAAMGSGSLCLNGTCKCMELYRYSEHHHKCVDDTLLGGACSKHEECHQPGDGKSRLECILGVCKCKPQFTEKQGYCIMNSAEGSTEINSISKLYPFILSYILFFTIF